MATPQNSGNDAARPNEAAIKAETEFLQTLGDPGREMDAADPEVAAAAMEAGEHPERAAELAADLGIGADSTSAPEARQPVQLRESETPG